MDTGDWQKHYRSLWIAETGRNGLPRVALSDGQRTAEAHVYLQGAHVTDFRSGRQAPVLYLSDRGHFEQGKAIRGGVPVIFPWFGMKADDPKAPQHGFARGMEWEPQEPRISFIGSICAPFVLRSNEATRKWWSGEFEATYEVDVGQLLQLQLTVRNTGTAAFTFEAALHTYLAIQDVRHVLIEGLSGRTFIDKVDGMRRKVQSHEPLTITGETDRVYLDTEDFMTVTDPVGRRRILIVKHGSRSTVVWNPWAEKAATMSDLGADEWIRMLCVETANVAENAVTLAPGEYHTLSATIGVERLA